MSVRALSRVESISNSGAGATIRSSGAGDAGACTGASDAGASSIPGSGSFGSTAGRLRTHSQKTPPAAAIAKTPTTQPTMTATVCESSLFAGGPCSFWEDMVGVVDTDVVEFATVVVLAPVPMFATAVVLGDAVSVASSGNT
mmetsp:Transcript_36270/g.84167  ORF Transcript_36270/g.84167 Transcript_36270/m.84167 type:complete len:142 (-) Transcript_36270:38-463(-)